MSTSANPPPNGTAQPTTATLTEYLSQQDTLLHEAAEALPHSFEHCTYALGYIRQAVYLCLTCGADRGMCSACSVSCHTDHEQVELFPKRHFRCDCPTPFPAPSTSSNATTAPRKCTLHTSTSPVLSRNTENAYNHNFRDGGRFCRCGARYDGAVENETMAQCLVCEDWFHESCCNLRPKPSSTAHPDAPTDAEEEGDEPDPLIDSDSYEAFVCGSCVRSIPLLARYAGTPGIALVVRENERAPWTVLPSPAPDAPVEVEVEAEVEGTTEPPLNENAKRPNSPSSLTSAPPAKRSRSTVTCLAPPLNPIAQQILSDPDSALGTGDIFMSENFRERWCRCEQCTKDLDAHPYLLEEEETYEPPEDPDSGMSLEELGLRALERSVPRERAIDGIHAFNAMRDKLIQHLKPFATEGRAVGETDIRGFFEELKEQQKSKPR